MRSKPVITLAVSFALAVMLVARAHAYKAINSTNATSIQGDSVAGPLGGNSCTMYLDGTVNPPTWKCGGFAPCTTYTASGTYTSPPGSNNTVAYVFAAGGGGGGGGTGHGAGGGGEGGAGIGYCQGVQSAATVTVGTGGGGGWGGSVGTKGGTGGSSSFCGFGESGGTGGNPGTQAANGSGSVGGGVNVIGPPYSTINANSGSNGTSGAGGAGAVAPYGAGGAGGGPTLNGAPGFDGAVILCPWLNAELQTTPTAGPSSTPTARPTETPTPTPTASPTPT